MTNKSEWRATYAERFLARAIQRPERPRPYVRLTDEQIELLPESMRAMALMSRSLGDAVAQTAAALRSFRLPGGPE